MQRAAPSASCRLLLVFSCAKWESAPSFFGGETTTTAIWETNWESNLNGKDTVLRISADQECMKRSGWEETMAVKSIGQVVCHGARSTVNRVALWVILIFGISIFTCIRFATLIISSYIWNLHSLCAPWWEHGGRLKGAVCKEPQASDLKMPAHSFICFRVSSWTVSTDSESHVIAGG